MQQLLRAIGVDSLLFEHWDQARLGVSHPEILLLGLALVPLAGWVLHRRHRASLASTPAWTLRWLTTLRLTLLVLMILVISGPQIVIDTQVPQRPYVAVVIDASRSMALPVGRFVDDKIRQGVLRALAEPAERQVAGAEQLQSLETISRLESARRALSLAGPPLWATLKKTFDVQLQLLADELAPVITPPGEELGLLDSVEGTGRRTLLGTALATILDAAADRPVSGIIVISDGQNTGGISLAQAAFVARRRAVPIITVPVGADGRPKDVALVDVFSPGVVSKGDTAQISVAIESAEYDGQVVAVTLQTGKTVLDAKQLQLDARERQHLDFSFKAHEVGVWALRVVVDALPEEVVEANNAETTMIRVTDEKLRALLVDGQPRWDYRFLRNALTRDPGVELRTLLEVDAEKQSAGQGLLPRTDEDYARLDVVILGDVSPRLMTTGQQKSLAKAVRQQGLGLIVQVGPRHMPHHYLGQPIESLLPVAITSAAGVSAPGYEAFRLQARLGSAGREVIHFYDDARRNQEIWQSMPPFFWCGAAERAKPAATVLLENATGRTAFGPRPILALHQAGEGTVLYVGVDSTWRWRQNVGDRYFYKVWGQALRLVARGGPGRQRRTTLEALPLKLAPSETVQLSLDLGTQERIPQSSEPVHLCVSRASLDGGPTERVRLNPDPRRATRFEGSYRSQSPGRYRVAYDSSSGLVETEFLVVESQEEYRRPHVDRQALETLANASGGRLLELDELDQIPGLLKGETRYRRLRCQQPLWDNWLVLILIAVLYCADVGIRRALGFA